MREKNYFGIVILTGLVLFTASCGKKKSTTFPATDGAPAPGAVVPPVQAPPAVNWNNPTQVNGLPNQSNLCYVSNSNYFAGQNYIQIAEPVYGTYYDYCAGYYRYYFQGYYYYFAPTGNCAGGWGPPTPQPTPKPKPSPSNSCGGTSKSYDSKWVSIAERT